MKMVTLTPARVRPEKVLKEEFDEIVKRGDLVVPMATAKDALKYSRGGYMIKPEAQAVEIKAGINLALEEMSNEQLKVMVLAGGKRIQKKTMKRSDLVGLARRTLSETITVEEDEDVDLDE